MSPGIAEPVTFSAIAGRSCNPDIPTRSRPGSNVQPYQRQPGRVWVDSASGIEHATQLWPGKRSRAISVPTMREQRVKPPQLYTTGEVRRVRALRDLRALAEFKYQDWKRAGEEFDARYDGPLSDGWVADGPKGYRVGLWIGQDVEFVVAD